MAQSAHVRQILQKLDGVREVYRASGFHPFRIRVQDCDSPAEFRARALATANRYVQRGKLKRFGVRES